ASNVLYVKDLDAKVAGTSTTYLELIRQVMPDLRIDDSQVDVAMAHGTVAFQHLSEKAAAAVVEGGLKLENFQPQWIKSEGRRSLLLELDVAAENANQGTNYEGEVALLAAFRTEPTLKLLNVMDVKTDRFTGFWEKPSVFPLSARTDVFLVYSTHWN